MMITITNNELEDILYSIDNIGYCVCCGMDYCGIEPDARNYPCDCCGRDEVYGVSELLMMGMIQVVD